VAVISIGVIAPAVALVYGTLPTSASVDGIFQFVGTFFALGVFLHLMAEVVLSEMVPQ
jgi:hypothetical protein